MTTTRKTAATKKQEAPKEALEAPEAKETPQEPTELQEANEAPKKAVEAPETLTVVVVSKFIDKYTGDARNVGDVIEVTHGRLDELNAAGAFVVNPAK